MSRRHLPLSSRAPGPIALLSRECQPACPDRAQALSSQLDGMRVVHEATPNGRVEVIRSVERLQLFLDLSLGRFPWRHRAIDDAAPSERHG